MKRQKALSPLVREIREEAVAAKTANRATREVALGAMQHTLPTKRTTPSAARQNISPCEAATGFERLLTPKEMASVLRVSQSFLAKARMRGDGPPYMLLGRSVRYSESGAMRWMKLCLRQSISER